MCSCSDGDPPKVFERVLRKVRNKPAGHICCECQRVIRNGDWHEDASGLWDDRWDYFRTCLRCTARREAWAAVECRPAFTQLLETITECLVQRWYNRDRIVRHVDRETGRQYLAALRKARAEIREQVAKLEAERAERYYRAGVAREARKKALAWRGSGI